MLCYFKNEKITVTTQDQIAKKYGQDNKGKKLYSEHYERITDDDKEIYQPKYAKKYLNNIKQYFEGQNEVLKKIDSFISKAK